jgi:hypothetical protein
VPCSLEYKLRVSRPLLPRNGWGNAPRRDFVLVFSLSPGASVEATGKTMIVGKPPHHNFSLLLLKTQATGKNPPEGPLRSAIPRSAEARDGTRASWYSNEHGPALASVDLIFAKLFSGVAGEPSHALRFLHLILFLSCIPRRYPDPHRSLASIGPNWQCDRCVCQTGAKGNDGSSAARCCRCSINS